MQPRCTQQPYHAYWNIPEAPELGTPRYNGQNVGPQRCPLYRSFTVVSKFCKYNHLKPRCTVEPRLTNTPKKRPSTILQILCLVRMFVQSKSRNVVILVFCKADWFPSPSNTWTVQNSLYNPDAHLPLLWNCAPHSVDSKTRHYINIVAHCANPSQPRMATKSSKNVAC